MKAAKRLIEVPLEKPKATGPGSQYGNLGDALPTWDPAAPSGALLILHAHCEMAKGKARAGERPFVRVAHPGPLKGKRAQLLPGVWGKVFGVVDMDDLSDLANLQKPPEERRKLPGYAVRIWVDDVMPRLLEVIADRSLTVQMARRGAADGRPAVALLHHVDHPPHPAECVALAALKIRLVRTKLIEVTRMALYTEEGLANARAWALQEHGQPLEYAATTPQPTIVAP